MKKFQKHFVGKGKQVEGLQIIKVTVNMDDLNDLSYQFNGETYATFEVAKMKTADQFGREFTVYVSRKEEVADQPETEKETKPETKMKRPAKKVKESIDEVADLPF